LKASGSLSVVTFLPQDTRFPARYEAETKKSVRWIGFQIKIFSVDEGLAKFRDDIRRTRISQMRSSMESCSKYSATSSWSFDFPGIHSCAVSGYRNGTLFSVRLTKELRDPSNLGLRLGFNLAVNLIAYGSVRVLI